MIRVAIVAGGVLDSLPIEGEIYVGVDGGSVALLERGLPLNVAVGDFDSVDSKTFLQIQQAADWLVQAPAEKDDTDLELALKAVFARYPTAQVQIYGAFGGRLDHMMSNLFLASEPDLAAYMTQIVLLDQQNRVQFFPAGQQVISPVEGMTYVSFMPSDGSRLTIQQAKYPLDESNYFFKKCYSSNEFIDREIRIHLDTGYVVVIHSKDRSEDG